jgi:hypothetical protein
MILEKETQDQEDMNQRYNQLNLKLLLIFLEKNVEKMF